MAKQVKTSWRELVREAVELRKEQLAKEIPWPKLTAQAFMAEALSNAEIDADRLAVIRGKIEKAPNAFRDKLLPYIHRARRECRLISRPGNPGPHCYRPPHFVTPDGDLLAICFMLKVTPAELVAIAVDDLVKSDPMCFGTVENLEQYEAWLKGIGAKISDLQATIESKTPMDEITVGVPDQHGRALLTYKCTCGLVPELTQEERWARYQSLRKLGQDHATVEALMAGGEDAPVTLGEGSGHRLIQWLVQHPGVTV